MKSDCEYLQIKKIIWFSLLCFWVLSVCVANSIIFTQFNATDIPSGVKLNRINSALCTNKLFFFCPSGFLSDSLTGENSLLCYDLLFHTSPNGNQSISALTSSSCSSVLSGSGLFLEELAPGQQPSGKTFHMLSLNYQSLSGL